jgi:hypothetical protein
MPKKLKRHCALFLCFLGLYWRIQVLIEGAHKFGIIEHYVLAEICSAGVLVLGFGWFGWRAYTGMVRDMDFHDEALFH